MGHHKCDWVYVGHVRFSTDTPTIGKHEWECSQCAGKMYSQRIAPSGKIEVKKPERRFKVVGK